MSDVEITIRLPEELVERAREAGIEIDTVTPDVVALLEKRIERNQGLQRLVDTAKQLEGSLTLEEIEAELADAKADRQADRFKHIRAPSESSDALEDMASDPEIQRELSAIEREFSTANFDGLSDSE